MGNGVGVLVGAGVGVGVFVGVEDGVSVGPNSCPGPQPEAISPMHNKPDNRKPTGFV
jgi:hypothetical protein